MDAQKLEQARLGLNLVRQWFSKRNPSFQGSWAMEQMTNALITLLEEEPVQGTRFHVLNPTNVYIIHWHHPATGLPGETECADLSDCMAWLDRRDQDEMNRLGLNSRAYIQELRRVGPTDRVEVARGSVKALRFLAEVQGLIPDSHGWFGPWKTPHEGVQR